MSSVDMSLSAVFSNINSRMLIMRELVNKNEAKLASNRQEITELQDRVNKKDIEIAELRKEIAILKLPPAQVSWDPTIYPRLVDIGSSQVVIDQDIKQEVPVFERVPISTKGKKKNDSDIMHDLPDSKRLEILLGKKFSLVKMRIYITERATDDLIQSYPNLLAESLIASNCDFTPKYESKPTSTGFSTQVFVGAISFTSTGMSKSGSKSSAAQGLLHKISGLNV